MPVPGAANQFGFGGITNPSFLSGNAPIGSTNLICLTGSMTAAQAVAANVGSLLRNGAQYQVSSASGILFRMIGMSLTCASNTAEGNITLGWAAATFANGATKASLTTPLTNAPSGAIADGVSTINVAMAAGRAAYYIPDVAGLTFGNNSFPFWQSDFAAAFWIKVWGYEA